MTIPSGPYIAQIYDASDPDVKTSAMQAALSDKQDTLVSSENIKTINNTSLLGSGNLAISTTDVSRLGLLAEYRFNEASGRSILNYTNQDGNISNLFPAPESLNANNVTLRYGLPPYGTGTASRWNQTGFSGLGLSGIYLEAGTYTLSIWVKSNTGASQTVRQQFNGTNTSNLTIPATGWVRLTMTGTVSSAGSIGVYPLYADTGNNPNDVQFFGAQLEKGSTASDFVPNTAIASPLGSTVTWSSTGLTTNAGTRHTISGLSFPGISVYIVFRWPIATSAADPNTVCLYSFDDSSGNHPMYLYACNGGIRPGFGYQSASVSASSCDVHDGNWHLLTGIYDGTNLRFFIDDIEVASSTPSAQSQFVGHVANIGSLTNAWIFPGEVAYASIYNVGHTPTKQREQFFAIASILQSRLTLTQSTAIFFEGDSITEGNSLTTPWPKTVITGLSPIQQGRNFAVSGSQIADLVSRASRLDANASTTRTKNILCVLAGFNNLNSGGQSAATMVAELKSYCLARRAAGWNKIAVCTLTPATSPGINTKRNAANTLIRADTSFYDYLIDLAADSTIGTDAAASNTTYYSDGVHPTQAGANAIAAIVSPVIQAIANA